MDYDVIIVGGGPAGLSAGIYASRGGLKSVIFEKSYPGGLAALTYQIDNYPGFAEGIGGMELGDRMKTQAERFGTRIVNGNVEKIWKEEEVLISVNGKTMSALAGIIATGCTPKKLGVPGEKELTGKGVTYCATCDGPLYKDARVAVIGGGDSALQEALFLTRFANEVILVHRRDQFRAAPMLQNEVRANKKITLSLNKEIREISGTDKVEALVVKDKKTGEEEAIKVEAVFIYAGLTPNVELLGKEFRRDDQGFLLVDDNLQTSVEGIFAAGDVRAKSLRQVVTAAADGAIAAVAAISYIEKLKKSA